MPSLPRKAILESGSLFHVTWQCHNQDWLLETPWAKSLYYGLLLKYKDRYQLQIYSYCLMDNHIHLSGKMGDLGLFSDFFRIVNSLFARLYNQEKKRRGQVVMDRFKSPRIETENHLLRVMLYLDMNPKRAGKVAHPQDNEFSSFAYYAYGEPDVLITAAPAYLELGKTPKERQEVYQALVEAILREDWREKQPYSSLHFIGDPKWVLQQTRQLQEQHRDQLTRWRKRYREKFGTVAA